MRLANRFLQRKTAVLFSYRSILDLFYYEIRTGSPILSFFFNLGVCFLRVVLVEIDDCAQQLYSFNTFFPFFLQICCYHIKTLTRDAKEWKDDKVEESLVLHDIVYRNLLKSDDATVLQACT
jgi:hypothetical protein